MQEKNDTFRNFLIRTDELSHRLGINVQDLPGFLGVGRASLFCYRTGKREISSKTWLKLEAAERAAGIGAEGSAPGAERQEAIAAASGALTWRLSAAAEEAGGSEEERQQRFEELLEQEKMPLVHEILRMRHEVERLSGILDAVRQSLG